MDRTPSITTRSGRYFLTDRIREEVDFRATRQNRGEAPPPLQKPLPEGAELIVLPPHGRWQLPTCDLLTAIGMRESHRQFLSTPLELEELAMLLWATQGVREYIHDAAVLRTVPSAGCRHPFETYIAALNVSGLQPAIYRYLPLEHAAAPPPGACRTETVPVSRHPWPALHGPVGGRLHLDGHPGPNRMALCRGLLQGDRPGCRPCLPEPVPGLRDHRCRHLRHRCLPPGIDG